MKATLPDIFQALNEGGCVQFRHLDGHAFVVYRNGQRKSIDGRSYHGFLQTMASHLQRTEIGSLETHNLIIEWRRPSHE